MNINSQNIKKLHYKCNKSSCTHLTVTSILSFTPNHENVITGPASCNRHNSVSCVMWSNAPLGVVCIANLNHVLLLYISFLFSCHRFISRLWRRCKFFWQTNNRQRTQSFLKLRLVTFVIPLHYSPVYLWARRNKRPWCWCSRNTERLRQSPLCRVL